MSRAFANLSPIDLSQLPAPALVARLSYDECYLAIVADFTARYPDFSALLPSDPAIKLLEVTAYRETLLRGAINDAGRATMLAYAGGTDLDNLGAFYGLTRLIVTPATEQAPAILEDDISFRTRVQLAPELLAGPGLTGGGYRAATLTIAPTVKDCAVIKRAGGRIDLVLLGRDGDGTIGADVVNMVFAAFQAEDAAQLTDTVTVRAATIVSYAPTVTLQIRSGPDPQLIRTAAEAAIRAYAASRHRIGSTVYAQMIEAAASIGGVERALVDIGDVVPGEDAAPWLAALTVNVQVL